MINSTIRTAPANQPFSLMWIIETLLLVDLRQAAVEQTPNSQADGGYMFGL
ncbi:MAG: hypothetical protein ACJ8HI_22835 [Massilia sp.]